MFDNVASGTNDKCKRKITKLNTLKLMKNVKEK